jgi:hypothetical protein
MCVLQTITCRLTVLVAVICPIVVLDKPVPGETGRGPRAAKAVRDRTVIAAEASRTG